jgi:SAM-dependent methyltransferase
MTTDREHMETNRLFWDEAVPIHVASKFYDVASFKAGKSSLLPLEVAELGDVRGKSLLHLQCHFGMDTLSWARAGASVTGVDYSLPAIEQARTLAAELRIDARFVHSNVLDLPEVLDDAFDIVFASYGVLVWIPDVSAWARVAAHFLKPGGVFYLADGHPATSMFELGKPDHPTVRHSYFRSGPDHWQDEGTYADATARLENNETVEFQHTLGDIVTALSDAGLHIEFLHEHPYAAWAALAGISKGGDGLYRLPPEQPSMPLMFSVKATKLSG